jgi:mono/diheme cytochrome c family protein
VQIRIAPVLTYVAAAALGLVLAACTENAPAGSTPTAPVEQAPATDAAAVYRGATIARQVCAQCHDIGDGAAPAIYSKAPTFKAVVEKPETTAEGLAQWLRSSHPSMPHYVFPENEVGDITAYMMSLRAPR